MARSTVQDTLCKRVAGSGGGSVTRGIVKCVVGTEQFICGNVGDSPA